MERPKHWKPKLALGAVIGGIIAYEATCKNGEFITDEVRRIRQSKLGNLAVQASLLALGLHLGGAWEKMGLEDLDPIHHIPKLIKNVLESE